MVTTARFWGSGTGVTRIAVRWRVRGLQVVAVIEVVSVENETAVLYQWGCLQEGVGCAALLALYEIAKGERAES